MSATVRDVSLRYYVGNHNTSGHGSKGRDIVIVSFLFTAKKNVEKSYFFVIELNEQYCTETFLIICRSKENEMGSLNKQILQLKKYIGESEEARSVELWKQQIQTLNAKTKVKRSGVL